MKLKLIQEKSPVSFWRQDGAGGITTALLSVFNITEAALIVNNQTQGGPHDHSQS